MLRNAKPFFCKTLKAPHTQTPRVITVDKNAAYSKAINELKADVELPQKVELRQKKYLNNIASARPSGNKTISQTGDMIWVIQHGSTNDKKL